MSEWVNGSRVRRSVLAIEERRLTELRPSPDWGVYRMQPLVQLPFSRWLTERSRLYATFVTSCSIGALPHAMLYILG